MSLIKTIIMKYSYLPSVLNVILLYCRGTFWSFESPMKASSIMLVYFCLVFSFFLHCFFVVFRFVFVISLSICFQPMMLHFHFYLFLFARIMRASSCQPNHYKWLKCEKCQEALIHFKLFTINMFRTISMISISLCFNHVDISYASQ